MKHKCRDKNQKTTTSAHRQEAPVIPHEARILHQQGRSLGMTGELDRAIETFLQATLQAPAWPQLYFDLGVAYVYRRDNKKAIFCFNKVDELEPGGFLSAKTACHTLQGEDRGHFPPGTFLTFLSLETEEDPDRKRQIIIKLLERAPDFAPGWAEMVNLSASKREQLYYITRGLKCDTNCETRGFLFIQKALVLHTTGKTRDAVEILRNVANALESTQRNRKQARMILENWVPGPDTEQ